MRHTFGGQRQHPARRANFAKLKGFTLIELLVVIAILAAILFPVFARARENARRASCQSNLKQTGLGILQYQQDYDEKFPLLRNNGAAGGGGGNGYGGVFVAIQPYLKSTQILQCPSEPTAPQDCATSPTAGCSDYAYNLGMGYDVAANVNRGLAISALTQTVLTAMMCDGQGRYGDEWSAGCGIDAGVTCTAGIATFPSPVPQRHLETQNYLFADGHVKAYKGQTDTQSAVVYNTATPGSASGTNPTFNTAP